MEDLMLRGGPWLIEAERVYDEMEAREAEAQRAFLDVLEGRSRAETTNVVQVIEDRHPGLEWLTTADDESRRAWADPDRLKFLAEKFPEVTVQEWRLLVGVPVGDVE